MLSKKFSSQDETNNTEGKEKVLRKPQSTFKIVTIFLLSLMIVFVILNLPLIQQTQIHVVIDSSNIVHTWVETPRVSILSTVITPLPKIGIYSISIHIAETSETFMFENVQPDKYVVIWQQGLQKGIPPSGTYNIEIRLFKDASEIDMFTLQVTF